MAAAQPIAPELETRALTWPEQARALEIVTAEDFARAGEMLKGIKALAAEIEQTFGPHKRRANELHRGICAEENKAKAPLLEAERVLKISMGRFHEAQENARRAEQRRLEAEAREREEAERVEEAAALEAEGRVEEAEQVLATPAPLAIAPAPPAPTKVAGISAREVWRARVVDKAALVAAVAAGKAPLAVLEVNQSVLDGLARSLKSEFVLPGCEPVRETTMAARARR